MNIQRSKYKSEVKLPFDVGVTICLDLPFIALGDLDNRFKATLDLLVTHDILVDDKMKWVHGIAAAWRDYITSKRMRVTIFTREEIDGQRKLQSTVH